MRDFFEDLGKRIGETAETMTSKAGDAIEIQRLKAQIRGLARGNAVDLMELGKAVYDRYKAGEEVEDTAKGLCDAVRNREESIKEYEKKISRIKGESECTGCGRMVANDMAYCPYCGEKVPAVDEEKDETEEEIFEAEESIKEKMHNAAEQMTGKAEEAVKKAGEMADQAVEKACAAAGKAAEKTGDMAGKAAEKTGEMAEKAAEKISGAAEKVSDKINGK